MLTNAEASADTLALKSLERPGRTRVHPAEELNSVLAQYCSENEELGPTAIRAIGTAVTKLADSGLLYTADEEQIYSFLKLQNDLMKEDNFPFDLVEIALKILAEPDMPLRLYNDEWIKKIIDQFSDLCNNLFQDSDKKTQIHRLFPLYRHLSHVVQQIHLSDPSLYKLIAMSLPAYFHSASSPSLQTASCSLLTAIFKKYASMRRDIISDIFDTIEKNQGSPKYVAFPNDVRKSISAVARLFIELIQSITSFPCDTESITKENVTFIFEKFASKSRSSTTIGRIFEKFVEDICIVVSHPFYPVSKVFLKIAVEMCFPSIITKDDNTRISVKLLSSALTHILTCSARAKNEVIIAFPILVLKTLAGFDDDQIQNFIESPNSHLVITDDENCAIKIDSTFPSNQFEELTAHLIIALYLQQSMKLSEVINTSIPYSITQWSMKALSQQEMDNYLLWWRGMLPSNINFEWTLEIAEQICLHELCTLPMFTHVHLLVQHLLKGLENKNSNVRAQILRGLSSIIEIDPNLLFHPALVSQIKDAFKDPSAPIRDSVLQIISKYIFQNEQSSSPYFNVVVNCLADQSPMVVKRALTIVGELSRSADDECLAKLCYLLSTKLNDESSNVSKTAREAFIQVLFEDSKNPAQILISVIGETSDRPKWFSKFFKQLFIKPKYSQTIKNIIQKVFEIANDTPTYQNVCLIREFCETFPKICAPFHETLISMLNVCNNDVILTILPSSINAVINSITNPSITMFSLLMKSIENCIYSKSSAIIRVMIELAANITNNILLENDCLKRIYDIFIKFLRENLNIRHQKIDNESPDFIKQVNSICRALYSVGCICRYDQNITSRQIGMIWGPISHYFSVPVPKIRSMVLQTICDICIKDMDRIEKTKLLVKQAFMLGPPENISAVIFLKCLIEEEAKADTSSTKIDEIRPMYSSALIREFMEDFKKCFSYSDSSIRSAALELSTISLSYGVVNPPDILQYIISMQCSKDQHDYAMETLKNVIYDHSYYLNVRMKDGIKEAFEFVKNYYKDIKPLTELPNDDYAFRVGDIFSLMQPPQQQLYMNAFIDILKEAISDSVDPLFIYWVVKSLCNFPFAYSWEPSYIISKLSQSSISTYIKSAYTDAKALMRHLSDPEIEKPEGVNPNIWYASILTLMAKQWLVKKFQIQLKKLESLEKNLKPPVKVAMITPLNIANIPIPGKKGLNDTTLDLYAKFSSVMKMERSFGFPQIE
ncbi:hypothetical protein TRFO_23308 [Tritrichomonas foetus]|uniref:Sister chromatid cohesion protein n=1 Tax=Tritrichomonas foetus TaxID=1144522 RepID=A0A1J4KBF7_9EUKA|nr:hypothetical protein TRFO_23308 [Tritrichomonas foetus]|eukprot:OHT08232.1 hypothetical protein TRFO_23308 [Tritrichomonas foetus]